MNESPQPIQNAPITVEEIELVGDWRVSEMPLSRNASANAVRAPPSIQPTPPSCAPTSASMPPTYPAGASGRSGRARSQNSCSAGTIAADGESAKIHQPPR